MERLPEIGSPSRLPLNPLAFSEQPPSLSQNKADQDCYTNWLVGP